VKPDCEPFDVSAWRKRTRNELLAKRVAMPAEEHRLKSASILEELTEFQDDFIGVIAFYFPFRGEVDLLPLMAKLANDGYITALPVVVAKHTALQFRAWHPRCGIVRGTYGNPEPAQGAVVEPDVFIVPLVGFDDGLYRLGYGGGFYDRTFAAATKTVRRFGIGFEDARIDTIFPQSFDVPMDVVITENGPRVPDTPTSQT
jgi:5-formyltetrahydrofolate cyclo-ligase